MSDIGGVKSAELVRRLRHIAVKRRWAIEISEGARHTKVQIEGRGTVIPRHAYDLPKGTLHAIVKQLGLTIRDLE